MKKVALMLIVCLGLCTLTSSCVDLTPGDTPYGVWKYESEELSFVLDINPQVVIQHNEYEHAYSFQHLFPGEFILNGEPTEVYVSVFDPTNTLGIIYFNKIQDSVNEEERGRFRTYYTIDGMISVYVSDMVTLLSTSYRVVDGRLRLSLLPYARERYGTDYLYLELVKEYEIPEW